jgi:hypothetical protein
MQQEDRWLLTCLGNRHPKELAKSVHASDVPVHQGEMDAAHATALWSNVGVGMAEQRVIMKILLAILVAKLLSLRQQPTIWLHIQRRQSSPRQSMWTGLWTAGANIWWVF